MCGVASLDVDDIGSEKLGLGTNIRPLQHDFNHFSRVLGEMYPFLGIFGHYGALMGPLGHGYASLE